MRPIGESQFQSSEEVMSVHWLTPQEAIQRLDHEGEQLLIRQVSAQQNAVTGGS
jgi:hypothetical protein